MIRSTLGSIFLVPLLAFSLAAQQRQPPQGAVAPLGFLVGRWEGPATIDMGPRGGRREVRQREWVGTAAGGHVVTVVGQGREKQADGTDKLIFDAFAVIYQDREGRPALRAFLANGQWVDATFELKERGFVWGYSDPRAGQIRYTVTLTPEGRWNEVGERSGDGQAWSRFLEMTLERVGDQASDGGG